MKALSLVAILLLCFTPYGSMQAAQNLTQKQLKAIGNKIWKNEAGQSKEKLTWWLDTEEWASLGIGHFIWYPKGVNVERTQTFPQLLAFLKKHTIQLPAWLEQTISFCPWKTKDEFFNDFNCPKMNELRELLASTIDLQTAFIVNRFSHTLHTLLANTKKKQRIHINTQYNRVAQSPNGLYALIDYVNFKGEGINKNERYNNQGWGLLQILQNMQGSNEKEAVQELVTVAKKLLAQRVNNAPKKNEARFLLGWEKRVSSYLEPF